MNPNAVTNESTISSVILRLPRVARESHSLHPGTHWRETLSERPSWRSTRFEVSEMVTLGALCSCMLGMDGDSGLGSSLSILSIMLDIECHGSLILKGAKIWGF